MIKIFRCIVSGLCVFGGVSSYFKGEPIECFLFLLAAAVVIPYSAVNGAVLFVAGAVIVAGILCVVSSGNFIVGILCVAITVILAKKEIRCRKEKFYSAYAAIHGNSGASYDRSYEEERLERELEEEDEEYERKQRYLRALEESAEEARRRCEEEETRRREMEAAKEREAQRLYGCDAKTASNWDNRFK